MTQPARVKLAALLGDASSTARFTARRITSPKDLNIEVRGFGPLTLPVKAKQAKELCTLAKPAPYGMGEDTLLDLSVRNTWEIPKSRVKIDKRRWNRTLNPTLDALRNDLGLPADSKLVAELHSMLVYAPGQFFVSHQDSEKSDTMIGSLVVTLPSTFKGGDLIVEHNGESVSYGPAGRSLSLVAFYADCRHEITPIESSYRVVLIYNLLLDRANADAAASPTSSGMVNPLADCLTEHFATPPPKYQYHSRELTVPPRRLVYLLDHEYTQRELSWARLKGADLNRAGLLRAAAEQTDCDIVLALAEIHECWSCYEDHPNHRSWWEWDDDDRDDADDPGASYELDELIDSSVELSSWISPSGDRSEHSATSADLSEVCETTPSADLRPYHSEYEGYMGNYGNTMDRWYRRGAVVLWPADQAFAVRAEASPAWAVQELAQRTEAGQIDEARHDAASLAPFWDHSVAHDPRSGFLTKVLRLGHALDDPALAAMLLRPFRIELVSTTHAKPLAALADCYGERWMRELLGMWSASRRYGSLGGDRAQWLSSLDKQCKTLQDISNGGRIAANLLTQDVWSSVRTQIEQCLKSSTSTPGLAARPSQRQERLASLAQPALAVLKTAAVVDAADIRDEMVVYLCKQSDEARGFLIQIVRSAATLPAGVRAASGFAPLGRHCADRIEARLAQPQRADNDWSVVPPSDCGCELCGTLSTFLRDRDRTKFDWPIAKPKRQHIHHLIDNAGLPVTHVTRRQGSPYTLVLTKTNKLFTAERKRRLQHEADLEWLRKHWDV